ncbi:helix-turn-helix domain-containing protein [Polyangium mundeleinium]|uniref:helix-turn-helix domain-containing protein n=1 Tax=Polyangium mundeleinium TaxID=2995306 RepID=UPI00358DB54C
MGRANPPMEVTPDERLVLETRARAPTEKDTHDPRQALRAKIVLACAAGHDVAYVATHVGVGRRVVMRWRDRFVRDRLPGLEDRPRRGAPRRIADARVEELLRRTLEPTPEGARRWSRRTLARATGLSRSTVDRILRRFCVAVSAQGPRRPTARTGSPRSAAGSAPPPGTDIDAAGSTSSRRRRRRSIREEQSSTSDGAPRTSTPSLWPTKLRRRPLV